MENHHFLWVNQLYIAIFKSLYVYQRVIMINDGIWWYPWAHRVHRTLHKQKCPVAETWYVTSVAIVIPSFIV